MNKALLDTDTLSEIGRGKQAAIAAKAKIYRKVFGHYSISTIARPVQPPRLVADWQFRLRGVLDRLEVLTARVEFLIFMRDDRINAVRRSFRTVASSSCEHVSGILALA